MTNLQQRIIELEFYVRIQQLYNIAKNVDFLVTMLEGLRFVVDFNLETVVKYTNKFCLDQTWKPYKGEVIGILFKYSKIPMQDICKALNVSRPTGYKLVEDYNKDPYTLSAKVPDSELIELIDMLDAYNNLKRGI